MTDESEGHLTEGGAMTIKTYDDIQGFGRVAVERHGDGGFDVEAISHLDLRREAATLTGLGEEWEVWRTYNHNEQNVEVLWVPGAGRAGVAWGGNADWTDADDPQDALERYFRINGQEMCE
jgi:hypothetical protein